jgi:hypothetical protein
LDVERIEALRVLKGLLGWEACYQMLLKGGL